MDASIKMDMPMMHKGPIWSSPDANRRFRVIEDVVFLTGKKSGAWGSGYLRSNQLLEIVSSRLRDIGLKSRLSDDPGSCRKSLVIVSKTFIYDNSALTIFDLKKAGNVVACDFVDLPPRRNVCRISDILMSSSHLQDDFLRKAYPGKAVIFVPHHADLRIDVQVDPLEDLQVGYFGADYNALYLDRLEEEKLCRAIRVDDVSNTNWIGELANFKVHYAVRSRQRFDGYKPFTKGSIAAQVGAVILTEREPETVRCLGKDYPFFVESSAFENVRNLITGLRTAENGNAWANARKAMAKLRAECSPERISQIFAEMVVVANSIASNQLGSSLSTSEGIYLFCSETALQQIRAVKQLKRRLLKR